MGWNCWKALNFLNVFLRNLVDTWYQETWYRECLRNAYQTLKLKFKIKILDIFSFLRLFYCSFFNENYLLSSHKSLIWKTQINSNRVIKETQCPSNRENIAISKEFHKNFFPNLHIVLKFLNFKSSAINDHIVQLWKLQGT